MADANGNLPGDGQRAGYLYYCRLPRARDGAMVSPVTTEGLIPAEMPGSFSTLEIISDYSCVVIPH